MDKSPKECFLCCELKPLVACWACPFRACSPCTKRFLKTTLKPAHCMSCNTAWSLKFLAAVFDKRWLTGGHPGSYRQHCKNLALQREKARLPETIAQVPKFRQEEENQRLLEGLAGQRDTLKRELQKVQTLMQDVASRRVPARAPTSAGAFVGPCPADGCRGMIEKNKKECAVCCTKVCSRCFVVLRHPHACSPDDLKTMRLLQRDSKACPQCATLIHKIDGCDQMWCTQCRTAFSWRTLRVETGAIHNPHAIRWERETGALLRNPRDVPCGGLVPVFWFRNVLRPDDYARLIPLYRRTAEIAELIPRLAPEECDDLRKMFVLSQVSEEDWRHRIFLRDRHNARKKVKRDVLETLQVIAIERFRALHETVGQLSRSSPITIDGGEQEPPKDDFLDKTHAAALRFFEEMETVRSFTNRSFMEELPLLGTTNPMALLPDWSNQWRLT